MGRTAVAASKSDGEKSTQLPTISKSVSETPSNTFSTIQRFQRSAGNRAAQRLLGGDLLQTKLRIGPANDVYEQEADRVADQVMRMPNPEGLMPTLSSTASPNSPPRVQRVCSGCQDELQRRPLPKFSKITSRTGVQRACPECEEEFQRQPEEEEDLVRRKEQVGVTPQIKPAIEAGIQSSIGGGRPLSDAQRAFFEPRFGADLSQVRLHTGSPAKRLARSINARAFTTGNNIAFDNSQFRPATDTGKRLLAHELTHVIQQSKKNYSGPHLQRATAEIGGFRVTGDNAFVSQVRTELATLNGTRQGRGVLSEIEANRSPWYRSLIRIYSGGACGFLPGSIMYNTSGCVGRDRCGTGDSSWVSVPSHVYLFHEAVHAYLYYITGQGTHRERECMATGLGTYFNSIDYNENKLRCELGLPVRPCYDGECSNFAPPTCGSAGKSRK